MSTESHSAGLKKLPDVNGLSDLHIGEGLVDINGAVNVIVHIEDKFFVTKRDGGTHSAMTVKNNELARIASYPKTMTLDAVIKDVKQRATTIDQLES